MLSGRRNRAIRWVDWRSPKRLFATLVAKGAAWLVDRRDRRRHLDDSAVLLACVLDASELDYESMSKNDRKRILATTEELLDPAHVSWVNVDPADRDRGMFNLRLIRQVLGLLG